MLLKFANKESSPNAIPLCRLISPLIGVFNCPDLESEIEKCDRDLPIQKAVLQQKKWYVKLKLKISIHSLNTISTA